MKSVAAHSAGKASTLTRLAITIVVVGLLTVPGVSAANNADAALRLPPQLAAAVMTLDSPASSVLDDGVVTDEEVGVAASLAVGCMAERGVAVKEFGYSRGDMHLSYASDETETVLPEEVESDCFATHYDVIAQVRNFQERPSDAEMAEVQRAVVGCLRSLGHNVRDASDLSDLPDSTMSSYVTCMHVVEETVERGP